MLHPRARTMLLLAIPALIIGVVSSLVLIVVMKVASVLQTLLWNALPAGLGVTADSPAWIVGMLTLTGIAVGLVIRFSPGHAGPDPALEPLIGAPVAPSALPGLIIALIIGLAGGVSLGPEHPIMAVNIGLAVFLGSRILPRVGALDWTILASAGTIGALFGTPVAAALIFSQTLSSNNDVPLWDKLFAPLMAAAAGALTTSLFFHPHFSLSLPHYGQMQIADIFSGAIVAAIAIALGMVAVWCLPRLHRLMHRLKHPVLILGAGGLILGILGTIGGPVTLFKGLDEMQQLAFSQVFSVSDYLLFAVQAGSAGGGGRLRFPWWTHLPGGLCRRRAGADAARACRCRSGCDYRFLLDSGAGAGGHARCLAEPLHGRRGGTGYHPHPVTLHRDVARLAPAGGQTDDDGLAKRQIIRRCCALPALW